MTNQSSSALRAVVEAPDRRLALLRSLVDEDRWVGLGWDPATQNLTPDQGHPTLGHAVCDAAGCGLETRRRNRLCDGCQQVWLRSAMSDIGAFKALGVQRRR